MNFYTTLITRAIDYIEDNLAANLTPGTVAYQVCISEFHFQRLFKAVTGTSCGKYILGRKLTRAADSLKTTEVPVTELALDLGFEYPEVFSRAFKSKFGISPRTYRTSGQEIQKTARARVVERDFSHLKGIPSIKGEKIHLDRLHLAGVTRQVNTEDSDFEKQMDTFCRSFLEKSAACPSLDQTGFYSTISCHGEGTNRYTVLFGKALTDRTHVPDTMTELEIKPGWFCKFTYRGDAGSIIGVLIEDIYRWIALHEIKLNSDNIGMLTSYGANFFQDQIHTFLIPIIND